MSDVPAPKALPITSLPALKQPLEGGVFLGVTTLPNDMHCAIVKLNDKPDRFLTWRQAVAWAKSVGGELPSQPVAQVAFFNAKEMFLAREHWTSEPRDSTYAWLCDFASGNRLTMGLMHAAPVFAVRLIPLIGNAETDDLHKRVEALEARFATVALQERVASLEAQASRAS